MTSLANIGSFLFGTYDSDLSRQWVGDKVSQQIVDNKGLNGIKLKERSIFGIGSQLGMSEEQIQTAIKGTKKPEEMLEAVKKAQNITNNDELVSRLNGSLAAKYKDGFKNTSFLERFKINFNQVKHNDVVYRLFDGKQGATEVLKDFGKEVSSAKGFFGKAGKIAGKSLPFLGIAMTLLTDGPTIFKSFSEHGAGEGLKQTGRTATTLAGASAGMALGATIGTFIPVPIIGTVLGGIVGSLIGSKIGEIALGKSKVEEAKEQKAQAQQIAQVQAQQVAAAQTVQPSAFGTYSQPMAIPAFAGSGSINLGDQNSFSDSMSMYRQYSMVA